MDLGRGSETDRPSSKATNSEIVRALIVLSQDFFDHNPDKPTDPGLAEYVVNIDENNLVARISMALNAYRRQKDRMADIMDQTKRIVIGGRYCLNKQYALNGVLNYVQSKP